MITRNERTNEMKIKRGLRAAITVSPTAEFVLSLGKYEHANLDQYFTKYEDYVLLYPGGKICQLLPGENTSSTVEKYKQFLGKPYGKLELFRCLQTDFLLDENCSDVDEKKTPF